MDPGFKSLHECAVVCSVANFDKTLPSEKVSAVLNDKTLKEEDKVLRIKEEEIQWEQRLKNMLYIDMPTTGDASESGLIKFFQPISDIKKTRDQFPVAKDFEGKDCRLPFNSTNKYAFSINHYETPDSHFCIFTKGAPEKIWKLCTHIDKNGEPIEKSEIWDEKFNDANFKFGKNGERVLGFAKYHLPKDKYPRTFKFNYENVNF